MSYLIVVSVNIISSHKHYSKFPTTKIHIDTYDQQTLIFLDQVVKNIFYIITNLLQHE